MNQIVNIPVTIFEGTSQEDKEEIIANMKRFAAGLELSQRLRQTPDVDIPFKEQMRIINAEVKQVRHERKEQGLK